jgi:hypothetical protein
MLSSLGSRGSPRFPRGQRFSLSASGADAETAYRLSVQEARGMGRGALDAAARRWAEPRSLEPRDGVLLSELRGGPRTLPQLSRAMECCDTTDTDLRTALDRLVRAGLVASTTAPRQAA